MRKDKTKLINQEFKEKVIKYKNFVKLYQLTTVTRIIRKMSCILRTATEIKLLFERKRTNCGLPY